MLNLPCLSQNDESFSLGELFQGAHRKILENPLASGADLLFLICGTLHTTRGLWF
jgi:hypothetical protein